jgi:membrane protein DedA with SNARE-associated domain
MQELLFRFSEMSEWQIYALVTGLLLQGFILTIFPEEILILALGYLWAQEKVGFVESFICLTIGLLPANAACFLIARRYGMGLLKMRPFCWFISQRSLRLAIIRMRSHGERVLFITRFTPIIRGPIYMAAGISGMSLATFLRVEFLAACIQIPLLLYCGKILGNHADRIMELLQGFGFLMGFALLVYMAQNTLFHPRRARNSR